MVLLVIPKCDAQDTSFWMKVIMGAEETLAREGFALHIRMVSDTEESLREHEIEDAAGIIFGGHLSLPYLEKIKRHDRPMLVLTYPPYDLFPCDTMYVADREGACYLTRRLIEMGHEKIGYYGSTGRPSMRKRFEGVQNAAKELGAVISYIWDDEKFLDSMEEFSQELLKLKEADELPTLIMCSTDTYAQSLIFHLSKLGMDVPGDISVTGFNSDLADLWKMPLTSMGIDKREYGSMAIHYLLDRIEHPEKPFKRISVVPDFVTGATAAEVKK